MRKNRAVASNAGVAPLERRDALAEPAGEWTLGARWVVPVDAPPIAEGTLTIRGDRIVAVEHKSVRRPDLDLGNAAILPGLVNAHTHLDLSDAAGRYAPTPDITHWLRQVIAHRRSQTPEAIDQAIAAGIEQSLRHGVTLLGDIACGGASFARLAAAPLRAVVFHELLGLSEARARAALDAAAAWWHAHPATACCRPGFSPHAPYSFGARGLDWLAEARDFSDWRTAPVAIHFLESEAEREVLERRTGPFVAFLRDLGVWAPRDMASSPARVLETFQGRPGNLFVHCNYLGPDAPPPGTVVYCPRTHAAFGHCPHPFRALMARGAAVALATDSLASNPDLDVLAEARFVRERHPDLPGETLLRMITLNGAEALGWGDECGSLTPGKSADLAIVTLEQEGAEDPHEAVLASGRVERVLFRGAWRDRV